MKIVYDDQPDDVIRKVNEALAVRGLSFVDDGKEHDGFMLYTLAEAKPAPDDIVAMLRAMEDDDRRAEVLSQFCCHCGNTNPNCQCWNDE
jgi:hypothetical protein